MKHRNQKGKFFEFVIEKEGFKLNQARITELTHRTRIDGALNGVIPNKL